MMTETNRAQAASDRRAIADHETVIALHEMDQILAKVDPKPAAS